MGRVNGFFGYIKHNDMMSGLMFLGFLLGAQVVFFGIAMVPLHIFDFAHGPFNPAGYISRYTPIVLIVSIILFAFRYFTHVNRVQKQVGFFYLGQNQSRRLSTIVETLALTAGIQTPRIGVIDSPARNAFACGLGKNDAVIVVTRGLMQALTPDELEAVIAHEITHIVNDDIRLIALANAMQSSLEFFEFEDLFPRKPEDVREFYHKPGGFKNMIASFRELISMGARIGRMSRLMISASRELIADAEAVRLTHKPAALISALQKIENQSTINGLRTEHHAMMIDGAYEGPNSTHPKIGERIAALRSLCGEMLQGAPRSSGGFSHSAFAKFQTFKPQVSLWRRINNWLDDFDAKAAGKLGPNASLYDRVDPERAIAQASAPWVQKWMIGMLPFVSLIMYQPQKIPFWPDAEVATKQADGTYLRYGVVISKAENDKMKRDLRTPPAMASGFSPSRVRNAPAETLPNVTGLRGQSFSDDGGAQ